MDYRIDPLVGVGPIRFSMSREAVREHMKSRLQSFQRSPVDAILCDFFPDEGAFFYYDSRDYLEAIEFAAPATPTLFGVDIFGLTFRTAVSWLSEFDTHIEVEPDSVIAFELGVSVYAPLAKDDEDVRVESVLIFRRGYYN